MSEANPELDGRIEALLFSSEVPLAARRLADLTSRAKGEVLAAIDRLNVFYGESGRAFRIAEIAGGHQMVTVPEHAAVLAGLHKEKIPTRLSRAALETLAIIAFKQPVTRAEIDRIRGVSASDGVLRHLMDRKTVRIAGRAEAPGRPLLYGTTTEFLTYFGLGSVGDLPRTEELEAMLAGEMPDLAEEAGDLFDDRIGGASAAVAEPEPGDGGRTGPADGPSEATDESRGGLAFEDENDEEEEEDDDDREEPFGLGAATSGDDSDEEGPRDESHSGEESDDREGVAAT